MTTTTRKRNHFARPLESKTLCGLLLAGPRRPWLVLETGDVTCLSCINVLTEPWHGTTGGYRNHECRCIPCTRANTVQVQLWREDHQGTQPPYHGEYGYNMFGCRCAVCREEHRVYSAKRKQALRKARP
jgi:hypothetical protein